MNLKSSRFLQKPFSITVSLYNVPVIIELFPSYKLFCVRFLSDILSVLFFVILNLIRFHLFSDIFQLNWIKYCSTIQECLHELPTSPGCTEERTIIQVALDRPLSPDQTVNFYPDPEYAFSRSRISRPNTKRLYFYSSIISLSFE